MQMGAWQVLHIGGKDMVLLVSFRGQEQVPADLDRFVYAKLPSTLAWHLTETSSPYPTSEVIPSWLDVFHDG